MEDPRSIADGGSPAILARESDAMLRSAFDRSPSGISVVALDGRWLAINSAYCHLLGYDRDELSGAAFADFTHRDDLAADREFVAGALAGGPDTSEREKRYIRKDGSLVWASVRAELIRDESGEPMYFVSHLSDSTERRALAQSSRDSARTLRSVIDNTPAVIFVKGDDFRYQLVNREFERFYGVRRERIVGQRDRTMLPTASIESTHATERRVLAGQTIREEEIRLRGGRERVFLTTRFPLRDDNGAIHATCTQSTDITEHRREQRAEAERASYSAMIYSALDQDRFILYGQPIVNLAPGGEAQVELLIRMRRSVGGEELLEPREFLLAAERFDLIGVIDEWVIDRALELATAGHRVAVNLSARTMSDRRQIERIEQAILIGGAPAKNLVFEITETAVADNLAAARIFAIRLRTLGCSFALDDFGVGYAAFTYLHQLPVDYLKIDIQFVRDMLTDEESSQIVHAIVGVARQLGLETIAEGVENQATLNELHRIGVDHAQGFWIGRPTPAADLWQSSTLSGSNDR